MFKVLGICGKSGAGKDTLVKRLVELRPQKLNLIVPYTTRPPREGEVDGVDYHFISKNDFLLRLSQKVIQTSNIFNDWYYGIGYESFDIGKINIGVLNPKDVIALKNTPDIQLTTIYLVAEDKERILRQLERERFPDVQEICRRFLVDEEDFRYFAADMGNGFIYFNRNGELEYCVKGVTNIIDQEEE